jgi:hypothetical protein
MMGSLSGLLALPETQYAQPSGTLRKDVTMEHSETETTTSGAAAHAAETSVPPDVCRLVGGSAQKAGRGDHRRWEDRLYGAWGARLAYAYRALRGRHAERLLLVRWRLWVPRHRSVHAPPMIPRLTRLTTTARALDVLWKGHCRTRKSSPFHASGRPASGI